MIVEIDKETFFKYLIEVDDSPYQTVGVSDYPKNKNPYSDDNELTLNELLEWDNCEYFHEINENDATYDNFYIVRTSNKYECDKQWFVFEGCGWSVLPGTDKWNKWPESLTCLMYGGWTAVRYNEIYSGFGFDNILPFVDLIKHFENLRDIFKMKNIVGR